MSADAMTDRRLLEAAAKAAGIPLDSDGDRTDIRENGGSPMRWNPLTSDGDALRLAVKLQLTICNEHCTAGAAYCTRGDWSGPVEDARWPDAPDVVDGDYAATRRAIVRAAAAMATQAEAASK